MKRLTLLLFALFLTACVNSGPGLVWGNSEFYEIDRGEGIPNYYFQYPSGAKVESAGTSGSVTFQECKAVFYDHIKVDKSGDMEVKFAEIDGKKRESWFKENSLVMYAAYGSDSFVFWIYEDGKDVSRCIGLADKLAGSFTNKPYYQNDKFGFRVNVLSDYSISYMPSGEGITMRKDVKIGVDEDQKEDESKEAGSYPVEIGVSGWNNLTNYENLAAFISDKYSGFSVEFMGGGVFVNEEEGKDAIRRYFVMNEEKTVMFEAYLRVNSKNYSQHKAQFDEFAMSIGEI